MDAGEARKALAAVEDPFLCQNAPSEMTAVPRRAAVLEAFGERFDDDDVKDLDETVGVIGGQVWRPESDFDNGGIYMIPSDLIDPYHLT